MRGGPRFPADSLPVCDYLVLVSPGHHRPRAGVWPISLRDALPNLTIPLAAGDQSVVLELQSIFTTAFDEGGYAPAIHQREPETPLRKEDAAWAAELLQVATDA